MMCYDEPFVVNHGVLCRASGCEAWSVMLIQGLSIVMCYADVVVMNDGVLC